MEIENRGFHHILEITPVWEEITDLWVVRHRLDNLQWYLDGLEMMGFKWEEI